ncbi:MAG: choice-of-anchor J domain-containing protein [Flavobacteriaceae bacterium]|jgi:gliding motility-associated-like protein|nr:choice-of-anchor J domain-containing protein [Flavobacteriaceae bacterium]
MKKLTKYLVFSLFIASCVVVYAYAATIDNLFWNSVTCETPDAPVEVSKITSTTANFSWTDANNIEWEYFVKAANNTPPVGSGNLTKSKSVTVTSLSGTTQTLQPNTFYDFYLRSSCSSNEKSAWIGPYRFRTQCNVFSLPFTEGFNSTSTSLSCWDIVDANKDGSGTKNSWNTNTTKYEGNQSMYYTGGPSNDDWLISPQFTFDDTKIYKVSFFYRTHNSFASNFEVLYSSQGGAPKDFTKKLKTINGYKSATWVEEVLFISGVKGEVNIAWHVLNTDTTTHLYIDQVKIEEVGCSEPTDLEVKDIQPDEVSLQWHDDIAKQWEYVVQMKGGKAPTGKGINTTTNIVKVTADDKGAKLQPNTEYEYYVKSNCLNGNESKWIGPFVFRTGCVAVGLPFHEDFDIASTTQYCWSTLDANSDATDKEGFWKTDKASFVGSHAMYYYIYDFVFEKESDDYLISPTFVFAPNKTYRIKYHYKTVSRYQSNEFELVASNTGIKKSDFTKVIVPVKSYSNDAYEQKTAFITNLSGNVNIAWHAMNTGSKGIYIDNVFVEEVVGCAEPLDLDVADVKTNELTLQWSDDYGGTSWEYVLQEATGVAPVGKGINTTTKSNVVRKDNKGNALQPNTAYEFYVRTVCGNGEYSVWSGPYTVVTSCEISKTPFFEGFNSDLNTYRCWSLLDVNKDLNLATGTNVWRINDKEPQEGDQAMYFFGNGKPNNDWLISPTIEVETGTYVLKYFYKAGTYDANFQVMLSNNGNDPKDFTEIVVPKKAYSNKIYEEEVVFLDVQKGFINLGWLVDQTGYVATYIDNIHFKKVDNCAEPYGIKITNPTTTTIDVEWKQTGTAANWEVKVVALGEDISGTALASTTVSGTPKTTITGLLAGQAYTVYIRANCDGKGKMSDWSTGKNTGTKVGSNDNCAQATKLIVSGTSVCAKQTTVSLEGATPSAVVPATCAKDMEQDIWFEFDALKTNHLFTLSNLVSQSEGGNTEVYAALYDQPCNAITANALSCMTFKGLEQKWILKNLTIGKKYYVRLGVKKDSPTLYFNVCITSSEHGSLEVSPSGDKYSVEELISKVLVNSNCDLVSNINYQVGDGSPATKTVNTLGYFSKGNSIFPFEKGIVLSTGEVNYVPGPYLGDNLANRGNNPNRWRGDKDINDAINDAGGGPLDEKRITQIEFDFIPINDSLKFDYLFASNSYIKGCTYACDTGALFAAWLVDTTTGEGRNLAKLKDNQTPIALNTVRDAKRSGIKCASNNEEYYWKHYANNVDEPIDSPIDFVGMTKEMSSETVKVVPFRKYHIKLAVMDFCTNNSHTSAVFFNAGSFDLGNIKLGADMLVDTGNALCADADVLIESGVVADPTIVDITWYKDDVLIPNATAANYLAKEAGTYKVKASYKAIDCPMEGSIVIEKYPAIKELVQQPNAIEVCRQAFDAIAVDLSQVEATMFGKTDVSKYSVTYFEDNELKQSITEPNKYLLTSTGITKDIYVKVVDKVTTCEEVFVFSLIPVQGNIPSKPKDVLVCEQYVLPNLPTNQSYYERQGGKGKSYKGGDILKEGIYTLFVLQDNGGGCYEEVSFIVEVTPRITMTVIEDKVLSCELFELPKLPTNHTYFMEVQGKRVPVLAGTLIPVSGTRVFVEVKSDNEVCYDEYSFVIEYEECPIPKGFSPNGDGINDAFDLSQHGVNSLKVFNRQGVEVYSFVGDYKAQWTGKATNGKELPSGTYYYIIQANNTTRTGWVQINR